MTTSNRSLGSSSESKRLPWFPNHLCRDDVSARVNPQRTFKQTRRHSVRSICLRSRQNRPYAKSSPQRKVPTKVRPAKQMCPCLEESSYAPLLAQMLPLEEERRTNWRMHQTVRKTLTTKSSFSQKILPKRRP